MANDKRQYPYYGRSSSNVYSGFPATNSQESFIPQSRHQIPQLEIAPSTMPFDRALDVWNGMSEPNSPNLGLDNILPPASGVDERSTNVRVSTLSHPSSHTLQMPSNSPNEISPDPLSRFYNETGPWTPKGIADINNQPVALPRHPRPLGLPMRYNEPNFPFSQYQTTAGSELESSTTGPYPSDSGYGTRSQATTSWTEFKNVLVFLATLTTYNFTPEAHPKDIRTRTAKHVLNRSSINLTLSTVKVPICNVTMSNAE
ncbi:MAG: hypothetical protein M1830_008426 [Pleopsidium flavum]|nr:MAG: hypothetical protein M1830_008426 [Pleopsidium flavum]